MTLQVYALNKDYAFNLNSSCLSVKHGLITTILKLTYWYERSAYENVEFDEAYKHLKEAGWDRNYLKKELKAIYHDVAEHAEFIKKSDFNEDTHVYAMEVKRTRKVLKRMHKAA